MPRNPATSAEPAKAVHRGNPPFALITVFVMLAVVGAACGKDSSDKGTDGKTTTTLSAAGKQLQAGLAAQGAGDLDKAKEAYLAVLAAEPNNKVAHYDLGVVYQQLNDVKSATDAYTKALAVDPKYQPALFNLAVLLTATDAKAAAGYYRQILAINPDDANVHFNLGLLLRQSGAEAEGNAEVAKALELDPALASRLPTSSTTIAPAPSTTTKR